LIPGLIGLVFGIVLTLAVGLGTGITALDRHPSQPAPAGLQWPALQPNVAATSWAERPPSRYQDAPLVDPWTVPTVSTPARLLTRYQDAPELVDPRGQRNTSSGASPK
jgi:hypothetical protein